MNLRVIREPTRADGTTLGVLFKDGVFFGFTLEDAVREVAGQPVESWKVKGETAIPQGRYRVVVTPSVRFHRPLPLLLDVPGFDGIRIHPLNTSAETEGCIGVGFDRDDRHGTILRSAVACEALQAYIDGALAQQQPVWIQVERFQGDDHA
jgi:hypothetical protein